jgi:outer membrane protein TolC
MRKFLLSFLLISLSSLSQAQDVQKPLTWQDCLRLTAARNPQLLSALLSQEASQAQYYGSYNGILPQVSLTHSFSDNSSAHPTLLADGTSATLTTESKSWQAQGTASLDLIDFNQWFTIKGASAAYRQAQANFQLASSNALLTLYKAFSTLLYSQDAIDVTASIRDLLNTNAQMIALRYDSGAESKGNNMQTQAQFLQADLGLAQAGRNLRVAQQQLAQAIGQDEFSVLIVTGTWMDETPTAKEPPDFDPLLNQLPNVRVQQAVVDAAKATLNAARSTLLPTLTKEFPDNPYWTFTGLLSYPLFSSGLTSTYYASAAAKRNYEKAQQDLRTIREQARLTLENSWSSLAQAEDQVKIQRAFLASAIQRKQESDITYQSGLLSYQDWELVTNDYVNFQQSYLSAQQNLLAAEGQWRFATGRQLGD